MRTYSPGPAKPKKKVKQIITKSERSAIENFNKRFPVLLENLRDGKIAASDVSNDIISSDSGSAYSKLRKAISTDKIDPEYLEDTDVKTFIDKMSSLLSIIMFIGTDKEVEKKIVNL